MVKRSNQFGIFLLLYSLGFARCQSATEEKKIHYEVVGAVTANDSLAFHLPDYKEDFGQWKTVYEQCMHDSLFPNAFFLGLQENLGIGSVCNQVEQNINKKVGILDTSGNSDIFNIVAVINSANCFSKINLNESLQNTFYKELIKNLKTSMDFQYLTDLMDTSQITFNITTFIDYTIRTDTLVSRLQQTKDSSLLYFKQILTTPGNGMLTRAAMIMGFDSEFHLKRKLTPEEETRFKNEVYFNIGEQGRKGSIKMLDNQDLKVVINKYYTVFGQFYVFK